MSRMFAGATLGWLVVATLEVTAQQGGFDPRSTVSRPAAVPNTMRRTLPGTRADVFTTVQGNALTSTNGSLSNAFVRLRDARGGRIVETQVTDGAGLFSFRSIDPGTYIVEIIGQDQASVLAASQLLNVGAGEAVSAVVKLPFRLPPFAGILGSTTPSVASVTSQAAASGVMATQISGTATCDSLQ